MLSTVDDMLGCLNTVADILRLRLKSANQASQQHATGNPGKHKHIRYIQHSASIIISLYTRITGINILNVMHLQTAEADVHSQEKVPGKTNDKRFFKSLFSSIRIKWGYDVSFIKVFSVETPDSKVAKLEPELTTTNHTSVSNISSPIANSQTLNISKMVEENISNMLFSQLFPSTNCPRGLQCIPEASCQVTLSIWT